jgi:hypothetical protein
MAKNKKDSNLDYIITKLKNSVGDIKVVEHVNGVSFGGIHEVDVKKETVTIINETGLEKINLSEKDNLPTESIYTDANCVEVISLKNIKSIK